MQPGFVQLSPTSFLRRTAAVYPGKMAVITPQGHAETYLEFATHAEKLASALRLHRPEMGSTIAILSRNSADLLRMHYAVPGAGAVLVALNTRLAASEYEYILADSNACLLFIDPGLEDRIEGIRDRLTCQVITLPDPYSGASIHGAIRYAEWLGSHASTESGLDHPDDETSAIAINYTSGTTGRPKGAIYTHRGAYLNALGVAMETALSSTSRYLWTLPMFHCNGWCFTWAVTAVGATHVVLPDFEPSLALELIERHGITHLCGAPVVLNSLADAGRLTGSRLASSALIATGGAPPSPTTIRAMNELNIDVIHLYGLTESYGPSVVCAIQPDWAGLAPDELATVMARQGVRTITVEGLRVVNRDTFEDVPEDGVTIGEIILRSNTVVPRYHGDAGPRSDSFREGWFLTGDLAVRHPDGYVEVKDRRKDIIISGGENVSSIEVENVLVTHSDVREAAVVAASHRKWGEVPVAFVTLNPGSPLTEEELIDYVRGELAHFKAPKAIVFADLPKTSTGKVQKFALRERAESIALEREESL